MTDQLNSETSDGVEAPGAAGEGVHAVGDRREMMKKFGRFAAYTAPAMVALYSATSAKAATSGSHFSGGNGGFGGGNGGFGGGNGGFGGGNGRR